VGCQVQRSSRVLECVRVLVCLCSRVGRCRSEAPAPPLFCALSFVTQVLKSSNGPHDLQAV